MGDGASRLLAASRAFEENLLDVIDGRIGVSATLHAEDTSSCPGCGATIEKDVNQRVRGTLNTCWSCAEPERALASQLEAADEALRVDNIIDELVRLFG